ncbi:DUF2953 domain-containing protein [Clostridium thailandense]|uniref:DUF2953 domain-containing protein n=1 Tax=Clostridium thailandense TaxID=2794346 RepID=A0A949TQQ0_9CLOT|nr:DUF2953 domain-containing protein [Clostridium thailandense]MBV7276780.1 DUF2953 domain-containing protein [Clostridium thailandense]MCH5136600.1 DUF2953 domain-containing protein [Clostridiaceae bacterium UIB06]
MHALYIGIPILFLILFISIPIKIRVEYNIKTFKFTLYNIDITDKINYMKTKFKIDVKYKEDQIPAVSNTSKVILNSLRDIKFKPNLNIKINIHYGLSDAAYTALVFGLLSNFICITIKLSSLFINIKNKKLNIVPEFNKLALNLEIDSIIFINLAKFIYISSIIYKNLRNSRKINLANT